MLILDGIIFRGRSTWKWLTKSWKEYLQLYPDWRIRTVSSIPVYRSCRSTKASLNLNGSFSAFERMHFTKYGSAWPSVSISLLNEAWNWALMLGGFFFLCKWRRDLVMRSCNVSLVRCFKEFTSSKCFGRPGLDLKFLFLVRIPCALSKSLLLAELANIPSLSSKEVLLDSLLWRIPVLPFQAISNVSCWFFSFRAFMPWRSERGVLGLFRVIPLIYESETAWSLPYSQQIPGYWCLWDEPCIYSFVPQQSAPHRW